MEFQLFTGKNVEDALTKALVELGVTSDKVEYEVLEKGSNGILGIGSKPAKINVRVKEDEVIVVSEAPADIEAVIVEFLSKVFAAMNLTVKINVNITDSLPRSG